jgi:hypothetical protein
MQETAQSTNPGSLVGMGYGGEEGESQSHKHKASQVALVTDWQS